MLGLVAKEWRRLEEFALISDFLNVEYFSRYTKEKSDYVFRGIFVAPCPWSKSHFFLNERCGRNFEDRRLRLVAKERKWLEVFDGIFRIPLQGLLFEIGLSKVDPIFDQILPSTKTAHKSYFFISLIARSILKIESWDTSQMKARSLNFPFLYSKLFYDQ